MTIDHQFGNSAAHLTANESFLCRVSVHVLKRAYVLFVYCAVDATTLPPAVAKAENGLLNAHIFHHLRVLATSERGSPTLWKPM